MSRQKAAALKRTRPPLNDLQIAAIAAARDRILQIENELKLKVSKARLLAAQQKKREKGLSHAVTTSPWPRFGSPARRNHGRQASTRNSPARTIVLRRA